MIATLLLVILLATAVFNDLISRRIPNGVVVLGFLSAIFLSLNHWNGSIVWQDSVLGGIAGLLFFLPIYLLGKMGAGDVKLLAMAGSFIGFDAIVMAGLCSCVAGGFLALLWSSLRDQYGASHYSDIAETRAIKPHSRFTAYPAAILQKVLKDPRYPYSPAIAAGVYFSGFLNFSAVCSF